MFPARRSGLFRLWILASSNYPSWFLYVYENWKNTDIGSRLGPAAGYVWWCRGFFIDGKTPPRKLEVPFGELVLARRLQTSRWSPITSVSG